MRLAVLRQHYRPDGGAEQFLTRALAGLRGSTDIEATIIARNWAPQAGVEFLACDPSYRGRVGRERSFRDAALALLGQGNYDLVQSHERIPGCDIFRAGDGVHAEWLLQQQRRGSWLTGLRQKLSGFHRYQLAAEKALFESPQLRAVICNSQMVKQEITTHFAVAEHKLKVIYNGLDRVHFSPATTAQKACVRGELGLSDKQFVFVFVGSGFERKGLWQVIQALAASEAKLLVVGRDKHQLRYQQLAEKLCPGQVFFAGVKVDVRPYLHAADAMILPSIYDPFPNAICEALASGLPVITSYKTGAAELFENSCAGLSCDALDVVGLQQAICQFSDDSEFSLRAAAARELSQVFDLQQATANLITLYREVGIK